MDQYQFNKFRSIIIQKISANCVCSAVSNKALDPVNRLNILEDLLSLIAAGIAKSVGHFVEVNYTVTVGSGQRLSGGLMVP